MSDIVERLFQSTIGALEMFSVYLGKRLGLYEALRERGALTAGQLAQVARIDPRYAREWLEQQAVAGFVEVIDAAAASEQRSYILPPAHVGALCDAVHDEHVAPFSQMLVGIARALPDVVEAYRTGAGVAYSRYGADFCAGQGGINRPAFTRDLVNQWLPTALPELHARLRAGRARVADVGCGVGWSTIALARAFPDAHVIGCDADPASIAAAQANARAEGVEVAFECCDAADLAGRGPFDLALVLETLHDLARPVEVLAAVRRALASDGTVLIADERVAEQFVAPGDAIERMMYGWSVSHCLPVARAETPSAAIGTAIRPDVVRQCATEAGFSQVDIAPVDNLLFRFYRLYA
jgi:hypothetical protein